MYASESVRIPRPIQESIMKKNGLKIASVVFTLVLVLTGFSSALAQGPTSGIWLENPPVTVYGAASSDFEGQDIHLDLIVRTENNRDWCSPLDSAQVGTFAFHAVSWPGTPSVARVEEKPGWGVGWGPIQTPFVRGDSFPSTAGIFWNCATQSITMLVKDSSETELGRKVWEFGSSARIDVSSAEPRAIRIDLPGLDKVWRPVSRR